jgi:low temperature requirement protein LtrA
MLAVGGLLLVFGMWWTYFLGGDETGLTSLRIALTWGYGHYFVFGAIAALGAGLEAAVEVSEHTAHTGPVAAGLAVAIPVVVFLVVISQLRRLAWPAGTTNHALIGACSVLVLAAVGLAVLDLGLSVLVMGLVLGATLATYLILAGRSAPAAAAAAASAESAGAQTS